MTHWIAWLSCLLLSACALPPPATPPESLLHDQLFPAPAVMVDAQRVFALSDEMLRFAATELHSVPFGPSRQDPRRALLDALYRGRLQLRYDAELTRDASQAFAARAGNCLSLVIMTAAFAKHLGLPVSYRQVLVDDLYSRAGDLFLASGHVNLLLERTTARSVFARRDDGALVVDFLPPEELRGQRSLPLEEATIVAMYLNNRAAEALSEGRLADAYAWARESLRQDPAFAAGINTLAVVYQRAGHVREAETALRAVLAREPLQVSALSNLVQLLQRHGRGEEAQPLEARLRQLQPYPPFHFFDLGRQAMDTGDFGRARALFARELRRQPDQHEVHFWAALADLRLGDAGAAAEHLRRAMANSPTPASQARYAGKLDHLRSRRLQ